MTTVETRNPTILEEIASQRVAVDERAGIAWLAKSRKEALARFRELGLPTTDIEEWRFTNVTRLAGQKWEPAPQAPAVTAKAIANHADIDDASAVLVFADGHFLPEFSNVANLPKGATVMPLAEAAANKADVVQEYLGRRANIAEHHFTALNSASWGTGAFLHIEGGVTVEKPVQLVFLSSGKADSSVYSAARNLFIFGVNSEVRIVETHGSLAAEGAHFNNLVTEAVVAKDARVDHYRVQNENVASVQIHGFYIEQEKSSLFRSHSFDFGAAISRDTIVALLKGEASEAILNGLYMPKGTQHHDTWMWVEHCQENIPSHELYKGILQDEASASFTGRIFVRQEAQKTDAKQTNQNLLLSDRAKVNTKPQLEIYADDVKCTHGATIGQLDTQSLFYLMSRGVDRTAARDLLVLAFASDVTERIRDQRLHDRVQEILQERLRS